GAIGTLIAETGGQNALIADSSALPEQLVRDVLGSAFTSAGQRCSAARVLFIQEDVADHVLRMLAGAMAELKIGDPGVVSTGVGTVLDEDPRKSQREQTERRDSEAKLVARAELRPGTGHGTFYAPRAYQINPIYVLGREVFGPVLHIVRWKAGELDKVIDA